MVSKKKYRFLFKGMQGLPLIKFIKSIVPIVFRLCSKKILNLFGETFSLVVQNQFP